MLKKEWKGTIELKNKLKKILRIFVFAAALGFSVFIGINGFVKVSAGKQIVTMEKLKKEQEESESKAEKAKTKSRFDAVLVLGAQVKPDGSLSKMLKERLDTGISIYNAGLTDRMIMSGDHGREDYDEGLCSQPRGAV